MVHIGDFSLFNAENVSVNFTLFNADNVSVDFTYCQRQGNFLRQKCKTSMNRFIIVCQYNSFIQTSPSVRQTPLWLDKRRNQKICKSIINNNNTSYKQIWWPNIMRQRRRRRRRLKISA
ncbi:hypothetical protein DERF_001883 [Dermatophagoides farinae]|uniref:Uncharacterized protein n=1 Tax=Dermatophagoides farinae TaxID=6954 RepID=A0A922IEL1_DERFA|nr:hypothetical protein DERF_001883 [Dermatophagoides farinae]